MLPTTPLGIGPAAPQTASATNPTLQAPDTADDSKVRFEQLLWAELLTHTGLEDALTLGGGEGAAMFSRFFVEAIASDIAKQHPLGLLDAELPTNTDAAVTPEVIEND